MPRKNNNQEKKVQLSSSDEEEIIDVNNREENTDDSSSDEEDAFNFSACQKEIHEIYTIVKNNEVKTKSGRRYEEVDCDDKLTLDECRRLIELVKPHEGIYNENSRRHKDYRGIWKKIARDLGGKCHLGVKNEWQRMRRTYYKENSKKSNNPDYNTKFDLYNDLEFLEPYNNSQNNSNTPAEQTERSPSPQPSTSGTQRPVQKKKPKAEKQEANALKVQKTTNEITDTSVIQEINDLNSPQPSTSGTQRLVQKKKPKTEKQETNTVQTTTNENANTSMIQEISDLKEEFKDLKETINNIVTLFNNLSADVNEIKDASDEVRHLVRRSGK